MKARSAGLILAGAVAFAGTRPVAAAETPPDLRRAAPDAVVQSLTYCAGVYTVKSYGGAARKLNEFDVRLKSDSSARGPEPGKPVVVPAGGSGDRVNIIFSSPREISGYIRESCS
jgi:cytochrome c